MSQQKLKLISLNIEKDKHIPLILKFIKKEKPDVICFQEIFEKTFELFKKELKMNGVYTEQAIFKEENGETYHQGVAILSTLPILKHANIQYTPKIENSGKYLLSLNYLPENDKNKKELSVNKQYTRGLLISEIQNGNSVWKICTTHFTWGYYGHINPQTKKFVWDINKKGLKEQSRDLKKMLSIFKKLGDFVFTADLNAPRGEKIFDQIAEKLTDNIPKKYKTSLDTTFFRAGNLPLMVDCLFTTKKYVTRKVRLQNGVSDHMAVVAEIYQK